MCSEQNASKSKRKPLSKMLTVWIEDKIVIKMDIIISKKCAGNIGTVA